MEKKFIATGKDFDSAVQAALKELGLELEDVSVQLLERAKNGVFGFGARPCKVEITYETPDPAPTPALSAASRSKPKKRLLRLPRFKKIRNRLPPKQPLPCPLRQNLLSPSLPSPSRRRRHPAPRGRLGQSGHLISPRRTSPWRRSLKRSLPPPLPVVWKRKLKPS